MMYGRKEGVIYCFTHLVGGLLSLVFDRARHENMAKGVKIQKKVSEVISNNIVVRMAMCIRLTYVRLSIHSTHCHDGAFS